ncbi:DNA methyltransferase 1-associated protein 1 [Cichlidogyrus casuarinus]|uniref:DNA methyltransferase 1-associated protein 1 n=1 Tax=Cichlidogyrus casuarinus TaxID=1844966 RepID=A0ABD2PV64_9PLAT
MSSDVLDILELDDSNQRKSVLNRDALLAKAAKKTKPGPQKRPRNIPREVWGLQTSLNNSTDLPPLMPIDSTPIYKQPKLNIGVGRVSHWLWVPFSNSARKVDGFRLHHWCRKDKVDDSTDYKYAKYDQHVDLPTYTDDEYNAYLQDSKWPRDKTDYLMELAKRFELRFVHMQDRWDTDKFEPRPSIEDLKERYYGIAAAVDKNKKTNFSGGLRYDAAHERKRKAQLELLYGRSPEAVEEEERLLNKLRFIEARRREREKKKHYLQKMITQSQNPSLELNEDLENSFVGQKKRPHSNLPNATIGSNMQKSAAAALSSNKLFQLKFPQNMGQKKIRIIENFLGQMGMDQTLPASSDVVEAYNQLRSNILLLNDLRNAFLTCEYELHTAKMRMETFAPDALPKRLAALPETDESKLDVDVDIINALKRADSKKVILPRQSIGIPGAILGTVASTQPVSSGMMSRELSTPMEVDEDESARKRRDSAVSTSSNRSCFIQKKMKN